MSALLPWIAVIVTVLAGWALIKRYQTHMVLLFAGLVILICVALMGGTGFLPKGVKPSGFWLFDIFATLKSIATKQSSGIGFLIMTAGVLPLTWTKSARQGRSLTWPSNRFRNSRLRTSCLRAATSWVSCSLR